MSAYAASIVDAAPEADRKAARKLGAVTHKRSIYGALIVPVSTSAQNELVRRWIEENAHAAEAFKVGNVAQIADARSYLRRLAAMIERAEGEA